MPEAFSVLHIFALLPSLSLAFLLYVSMQIYSTRDLEDNLNKIREICSDDKHDWDQRAIAVSIHLQLFLQINCHNEITFFGTAAIVLSPLIINGIFYVLFKAEKDPLTAGGGCSQLRLFLPAPTATGWSFQTVG